MGQQDKTLYLNAKDFSGNVSKGNVQTKADVEETSQSKTPFQFYEGESRGSPLQINQK